jgi:hypothetical protein
MYMLLETVSNRLCITSCIFKMKEGTTTVEAPSSASGAAKCSRTSPVAHSWDPLGATANQRTPSFFSLAWSPPAPPRYLRCTAGVRPSSLPLPGRHELRPPFVIGSPSSTSRSHQICRGRGGGTRRSNNARRGAMVGSGGLAHPFLQVDLA